MNHLWHDYTGYVDDRKTLPLWLLSAFPRFQ